MSLSTFYFQRFEPLKWHIKNGSNFNPLSTAPGIFRILQQKIFFHALTIITSVSLNYPAISQITRLATLFQIITRYRWSPWLWLDTRWALCCVLYHDHVHHTCALYIHVIHVSVWCIFRKEKCRRPEKHLNSSCPLLCWHFVLLFIRFNNRKH